MEPQVRRADGLLHLRYSLPHHIYCAAVYPRSAPNGSEIIVCGHEHGLSIIWRGGRPLKESTGNTKDGGEHMAVDGDGEDDYEPDEDEVDPSRPYQPIIQHIELPLGTAVLHITFPYLRQSRYDDFVVQPQLLQEEMVVGLACQDKSIRVLSLSLAPPSEDIKSQQDQLSLKTGSNAWIDSIITVSKDDHRTTPRGISLAFALHKDVVPDADSEDEDDVLEDDQDELWDLLVASHSTHVTGIMHLHRVPLSDDATRLEPTAADTLYWQTERLAAPAEVVRITVPFNPGGVTWPRVLVAAAGYPIRIFECYTESDTDHGQWSQTIYPGFHEDNDTSGIGVPHQKAVVDAQWAMAGSAILALFETGEWRMYDVSLRGGAKTLSGNIPTKSAVSGYVSKSTTNPPSLKVNTPYQNLAPMTPSTRKSRQEALFTGRQSLPSSDLFNSGGIVVVPTRKPASNGFIDETLVIWAGESATTIPSFAAYYRNRKDSSDPFSGGVNGQARELPRTDLDAEMRTAMGVFAAAAKDKSSRLQSKHCDFFVAGQCSFVIVAAPLQPNPKRRQTGQIEKRKASEGPGDDAMLAQGDLDVGGLDRMLDSMADHSTGQQSPSLRGKRSR